MTSPPYSLSVCSGASVAFSSSLSLLSLRALSVRGLTPPNSPWPCSSLLDHMSSLRDFIKGDFFGDSHSSSDSFTSSSTDPLMVSDSNFFSNGPSNLSPGGSTGGPCTNGCSEGLNSRAIPNLGSPTGKGFFRPSDSNSWSCSAIFLSTSSLGEWTGETVWGNGLAAVVALPGELGPGLMGRLVGGCTPPACSSRNCSTLCSSVR